MSLMWSTWPGSLPQSFVSGILKVTNCTCKGREPGDKVNISLLYTICKGSHYVFCMLHKLTSTSAEGTPWLAKRHFSRWFSRLISGRKWCFLLVHCTTTGWRDRNNTVSKPVQATINHTPQRQLIPSQADESLVFLSDIFLNFLQQ